MAIRAAARWKPDTYRSSLQSTIADLNTAVTPATGSIVMTAQLVVYDDTVVSPGNYQAGEPATESKLVVIYERVYTKELATLGAMSQANATAEWVATLQAFATELTPHAVAMVRAVRSARIAPPVLI